MRLQHTLVAVLQQYCNIFLCLKEISSFTLRMDQAKIAVGLGLVPDPTGIESLTRYPTSLSWL